MRLTNEQNKRLALVFGPVFPVAECGTLVPRVGRTVWRFALLDECPAGSITRLAVSGLGNFGDIGGAIDAMRGVCDA